MRPARPEHAYATRNSHRTAARSLSAFSFQLSAFSLQPSAFSGRMPPLGVVMFKVSVLLVGTILLAGPVLDARQPAQPQRPAAIPSIEDRTSGMKKIDGYFPLYWDERAGALLVEIPRLDADFLLTTGLSAGLGSNDIGLDRGQGGQGRIVQFQRMGPRVMLVQGNQSFRSSGFLLLDRND